MLAQAWGVGGTVEYPAQSDKWVWCLLRFQNAWKWQFYHKRLHQSLGPCVCLSLSVSSADSLERRDRLVHSPARASKTVSRRCPVPSPPLERAPGAFMRDLNPVSRTLLVFCVNQGVSASFSLSLCYSCLRTTRSQFIKGPQQ